MPAKQARDRAEAIRAERLEPRFERLKPLHASKRPPGPADWLAIHAERGQTVAEYKASNPVRPTATMRRIDLQPIGRLNRGQTAVVKRVAGYVEDFFGLPVRLLDPLPLEAIPASARRARPDLGTEQILTTYVLEKVLPPRRSPESLATIALTAEDLYPAPDWNFVFGQASLHDRVGVWSLHRYGDPESSDDAFRTCWLRATRTAVHELSHMLSITHCIAYECVMNGSNHMSESDARPLDLCPSCLEKLCWNLGYDPALRYERLAKRCETYGLADSASRFRRSAAVLREERNAGSGSTPN